MSFSFVRPRDMASSSSPSPPPLPITIPQGGYDVFISFRGKDTRNNFSSHLHAALCQKLVLSFIDSKHLRAGDEISAKLLEAIEGCKLYLIIFSPNYASSKWCLLELEKILECKKMKGKTVMPVFYKVKPSNVRYQTGSFGDALHKHEEGEKMDRVQRWRAALYEAGNLSGWDWADIRPESELIKSIVNSILEKLNKVSSTCSKGLVGMDRHVEKLKSLLCMECLSPNVCSVGIWGMGGIGKTTIARAFFDSVYSLFNGCFFANVREELARYGADAFKIKLLREILAEKEAIKSFPSLNLTFIRDRLRRKNVLIVFDDIDDSVLIELSALKTYRDLFGPGSKVVITSRDKHVLEKLSVAKIYKVEGLDYNEAIQLFSLNAFKDKCSPIGHMVSVERVINYAEGNPLALKVLGSALLGKNKKYWECALDQIEKFPKKDIEAILRISYDGLSTNEQHIFLDIACFFKGENKDDVIEILDNFRDIVYCCVVNLIDKCLITISNNKTLEMHHLLQELGWAITREESINPEHRSRLCDPKEICDVLTNKKGTEAIQSIIFDLSKVRYMHLPSDAFVRMNNLRFLKMTGWNPEVHILGHDIQHSSNKLRYFCWKAFQIFEWNSGAHDFGHGLQTLSNELRYLYWEGFPLKSLPSTFDGKRLVNLSLPEGKFERLWAGKQCLMNLKLVNLQDCKHLTEIPDLSTAKNIKTINLSHCKSLVTLHPSVQHLTNLQSLNLWKCQRLRILPSSLDSKSLQYFDLSYCYNVQKCPNIFSSNLVKVSLEGTAIKELPQCIDHCKLLEYLDVPNFPNMTKLPEVLSTIQVLYLGGTAVEEVPSSIHSLTFLHYLDLSDNKNLSCLPTTIWKLKALEFLYLSNCPKLEALPEILEPMECLEFLDLSDCYNLKALPNNISNLKSLLDLKIINCKLIRLIPRLPRPLLYLDADNCESLETLSSSSNCNFRYMHFTNCHKLDGKSRRKILAMLENTGNGTAILPGTEIPKFFAHRSVGSSITVPLPSNSNHLLVGCTFCIVYQSTSPSPGRSLYMDFKITYYDESNTGVIFEKQIATPTFPTYAKSDHLLLGNYHIEYLTWKESLSKCSKVPIEFCPIPGVDCLVKQCGVYFHFGDEHSDNEVEEYNTSSAEEFSYGTDEDCSKSMGEDGHGKGGRVDYCLNDAEVITRKRASDEKEEEQSRPTKKIKTL